MKRLHFLSIGLVYIIVSLGVFLTACDLFEEEEEEEIIFTKTEVISNHAGGSIEGAGYKIDVASGTIPQKGSDSDAEVTFSIEGVDQVEHPLPSNFTSVNNKYVIMGPEAFVFSLPLTLYFPIGNRNVSDVRVAKYDDLEGKWLIMPTCVYSENPKRIGISDMSLGTYALIENPLIGSGTRSLDSYQYRDGGVLLDKVDFRGYPNKLAFAITLKRKVKLKYPEQENWYQLKRGTVIASTGNSSNVKNLGGILLQGEYEIWVSMFTKPWPNEWRTYPNPLWIKIDNPILHYTLPEAKNLPNASVQDDVFKMVGWNVIKMDELGDPFSWPIGKPEELPLETETVGTGKFQATLTWANTNSSATDLDLHMYGPNDLHVFYSNPKPEGAAFNLDRDWMEELGNAIENIYSIRNDWPKGAYRITLKHFNGSSPKPYNIRILNQGKVKTYSGSISSEKEETIANFTVD